MGECQERMRDGNSFIKRIGGLSKALHEVEVMGSYWTGIVRDSQCGSCFTHVADRSKICSFFLVDKLVRGDNEEARAVRIMHALIIFVC